ncbi:MAG TPA: hypothetical protein VFT74_12740, partial [Isosphaeraceae bacterium]|nr:hypothetical protein [Isosphaeraceae bacterium]
MLRPLAIALLTASVMTWIGPSLSLAQAEEVTASAPEETGQARQAVEALESQLIRADDSARPALLNRLRKAYSAAANEAEMAGQADEAEAYRINAAILNERLGQEPTESGQEPVASPPPALADPEAVPPSEPAPAPVREPETRKPAEKAPGVDLASLPASPPSAEPKPPAPSAAPDEAELLSKADDLYRSEKYSEAGAIYTRLASANHLPENRRNAWAYCRRFEVVKRINGQPRSEGEWAAIAAEITAIRQLSPSVWWFDVYLQD